MLIVDDEGAICFSMSEYFGLHGYRVDTASELDEAEQLIESTQYEVAFSTYGWAGSQRGRHASH